MGNANDKLIRHRSAYSSPGLDVGDKKSIVEECLHPFPFIWASFDTLNLWYIPHWCDVPQLQLVSASY